MSPRMSITRTIDGDIRFEGCIPASDLVLVKLDNFDRALMDCCHTNAADWLLAIEMLFRRIQEQKERKE